MLRKALNWWVGTAARLRFGQQRRLPDPMLLAAAEISPAVAEERTVAARAGENDPRREIRVQMRTRQIVSRLFGASQPVDNRSEMYGRSEELERLTDAVRNNGLHGLIYGPRGSGKTSLARVFGDYADEDGMVVIYNSCAGGVTFPELMAPYLDDLDPAAFALSRQDYRTAVATLCENLNPRSLASFLSQIERDYILLILDEFDRIEDPAVKAQMAILIKLLADMRSTVRLLFVGISGDVDELIGSHASVRRHLTAVAIEPLTSEQVDSFIVTTGGAAGIVFTSGARKMLCWLARGSPYHMRLFSLHAALAALDHGGIEVDEDKVAEGLDIAYHGWRTMNERDGDLFLSLVRDEDLPIQALETFATVAAKHMEFEPALLSETFDERGLAPGLLETTLQRLAPALGRMPDGKSKLVFEDVLAPQFMLAACAIQRSRQLTAARVKEEVA